LQKKKIKTKTPQKIVPSTCRILADNKKIEEVTYGRMQGIVVLLGAFD
jgi:hypothetical protein